MNAIEITGLKKSFRGLYAVDGLNMTVPATACTWTPLAWARPPKCSGAS